MLKKHANVKNTERKNPRPKELLDKKPLGARISDRKNPSK